MPRAYKKMCATSGISLISGFTVNRGFTRLCRGIEAVHPELCSNIMFICGMSARGRTEFYQPIVEHLCSTLDETGRPLLT